MIFLRTFIGAVPWVLAYCCAATTLAQLAGGAVAWSRGALTREKLVRYAAIVYGLDASQLPPTAAAAGDDAEHPAQDLTREQNLRRRAAASSVLQARSGAVKRDTDAVRALEQDLRAERDRRFLVRKNFRAFLDQQQQEVIAASLQEVQRTLEALQARQAKELLLRMLQDEGLDENDDVVADVITIVKAMPEDQLKKVLGEFKSDDERQQLHRIMIRIGDLDKRTQR